MNDMTYIGIDPAYRKNGFTICIIKKNLIRYETMKAGFLDYVKWLMQSSSQGLWSDVAFCIENSAMQNTSFDMSGPPAVVAKKGRNVGMNQAISQCTVDLTKQFFQDVYEISPRDKGQKWDHETYRGVMEQGGYVATKKTSNQDERDAFKLALIAKKRHGMGGALV